MGSERLVVVLLMAVNGLAWWSMERRTDLREGPAAITSHLGPNLALTALLLGVNAAFDRVVAAAGLAVPRDRVHHSDPRVDVTTAFRQHPLETLWRFAFLLAGAQALGASSRAVAVYLAWSALNAQLEHAHVTLPPRLDRALRVVIATPAMHRVHHSRVPRETDSNDSNIFSFWDRAFRTYRPPQPGSAIATGLDDCDAPARQRTSGLLTLPFQA